MHIAITKYYNNKMQNGILLNIDFSIFSAKMLRIDFEDLWSVSTKSIGEKTKIHCIETEINLSLSTCEVVYFPFKYIANVSNVSHVTFVSSTLIHLETK